MEALTRKYGPLPGWAWAGLAVAAALGFWYLRGRSSSSSSGTSSSGSLVNNPAASTVPYVPSVTVTGIPTGTTTPSTPTPITGLQVGATAVVNGNGQPVLVVRPGANPDAVWTIDGYIPDQSTVTITGPPVPATWGSGPFLAVPINFAGKQTWVNAIGLQPMPSGGQGGWGYAGNAQPAGALGGWTVGWFPSAPASGTPGLGGRGGSGGPAAGNRNKVPAGPRLLTGGQGGGKSSRPARTGLRPLRRRDFSTRR